MGAAQSTMQTALTTIDGIPAHPLLVHFIVVVAPLTALLVMACAIWPAVRGRFVWLLLPGALGVLVLTPLTQDSGRWLAERFGDVPAIRAHTDLGETMSYVAWALTIAAAGVTAVHYAAHRGKPLKPVYTWAITALAVVIGIGVCVQVFRIGDSGARAVWGV